MPDGSLIGRLPIRMRLRKTLLTTWNSDSSRGVDFIFTWGDWDNSGRPVGTIATRRDIYVGENAEEAQRTAAEVISRGYRGFSPDVLVIGSPEQVAAQFIELEAAGYSEVIVRHLALPQANVVASTERLADVVAMLVS